MNLPHPKRISRRNIIVYILVALFIGIAFMMVTEQLDRQNAAIEKEAARMHEAAIKNTARTTLAKEIHTHAEASAGQLALLFVLNDKDKRITAYGEMDRHNAAMDMAIERIGPLLEGADDKKTRLISLRDAFRDGLQESVDALELNDKEKGKLLLSTVTLKNLQALRSLVEQIATEQPAQPMAPEKSTFMDSRTAVIGLGLGSAVIALLLGMMLTRQEASIA